MIDRRIFRSAALVAAFAFVACSDATEEAPNGAAGAEVPPALSEDGPADTMPAVGPGGGQSAPGATPETGAADPAAGSAGGAGGGPAGPSGSSAREGAGPEGGDDLGSRRDVGTQSRGTDPILERAARAYAGVRTLRADFEQTTTNPVTRRTTSSRGTIFQRRPDLFLMRFSDPAGDRIVSDGEYIWQYYPSVDDRQAIRVRAGAGGAGAVDLQAQFLGDPTRRFDATLVGEENVGGRTADVLVLTPRSRDNFRTLKVWIDRGDSLVRLFEITDHSGITRRFRLTDLSPNAAVDAALFDFTPPEGVHVVTRG